MTSCRRQHQTGYFVLSLGVLEDSGKGPRTQWAGHTFRSCRDGEEEAIQSVTTHRKIKGQVLKRGERVAQPRKLPRQGEGGREETNPYVAGELGPLAKHLPGSECDLQKPCKRN